MTKLWLLGAGPMAIDYAKVLTAQKIDFIAVGRSENGVQAFQDATGHQALPGGLDRFLESKPEIPQQAIIAVSIENLSETCKKVIDYGVTNILLEKPGVGYADEIESLAAHANKRNAKVMLAYNRRFYASVLHAEKLIQQDGDITSFHFEFTEWSHQIRNLKKHKAELENWFLGNSTHVIDTAFFLCGAPKEISCYHTGGTDWHPKSIIFTGAGISETGALFSYEANWEAPGRWNIDVMTTKHRYIFKPMEKLQVQAIGSVAVNFVEDIDYSLDEQFKPGLYLQTKAFLEGDYSRFCTIAQQQHMMTTYRRMSGY
jgi:predicted dehydrogenase